MTTDKIVTTSNAGENIEKMDCSYIAGIGVRW